MPDFDYGAVVFGAHVTCGRCRQHERWTDETQRPLTHAAVALELTEAGWGRTKDAGWICPECAESLTAEPES